jgi:hypothetical protein
MGRSLAALALAAIVLGLGGAALAQVPAPGPATGQKDAVQLPPPDQKCHGPRHYELMATGKINRETEKAQEEIKAFFVPLDGTLEQARGASLARLTPVRLEELERCLASRLTASPWCRAMASGKPESCAALPSPQDRDVCAALLAVAAAGRAHDPAACAVLTAEDSHRFCTFMATGAFDCASVRGETERAVCTGLESFARAGSLPPGLSGAAAVAAPWVVALVRGDVAACAAIPDASEAATCRASVTGDVSQCAADATADESDAADFACRKPLLYSAFHSTPYGTDVVVWLGVPYPRGKAECTVYLAVQGAPDSVEIGRAQLDAARGIVEVRHLLRSGVPTAVYPTCTWDPEASRFSRDPAVEMP